MNQPVLFNLMYTFVYVFVYRVGCTVCLRRLVQLSWYTHYLKMDNTSWTFCTSAFRARYLVVRWAIRKEEKNKLFHNPKIGEAKTNLYHCQIVPDIRLEYPKILILCFIMVMEIVAYSMSSKSCPKSRNLHVSNLSDKVFVDMQICLFVI